MRNLILMIVLLTAYGTLVLWIPEVTVSPGDVIEGHEKIANDCTDCHSPFRGTPATKCIICHELEAIGLLTTTGAAIVATEEGPPFHQALLEPDCVRCHSDHLGAGRPGANAVFTHDLLRNDIVSSCGDCHGNNTPKDDLHQAAPTACGSCHGFDAWIPATFDHETLQTDQRSTCVTCHSDVRPSDGLHRQAGDDCGSCHRTQAWRPATFEHEKYFRFDRHHPARDCQSCHPDTLDRYTCYGCHEHTTRSIEREHREEGIAEFEDCVECHRSGDEDEAKRRFRSRRGYRTHDD
jgi:hypothetical protein